MEFIGPKTKIDTLIEEYPVQGANLTIERGPDNWALMEDYEAYLIHKDWLDRVGKGKCQHVGEAKRIRRDCQGDPLHIYCVQCDDDWD